MPKDRRQVVQAMGGFARSMWPRALIVASTVIVATVMVLAWVLSDVSRENNALLGPEEHPEAPWWKYDPSAEVASVWGDSGDAVAEKLTDHGVTVIEVYPDAVLAALKPGEHEYVEQLGYDVRTVENRTITGRGDFRFDTLYGEPAMPENLRIDLAHHPDYDKFILQFVGPVKQEWKTAVESMGVGLFSYLPHNSFIVQMNCTLKESLMQLYYVQWIGTYQPAYKIVGSLLNSTKYGNEVLVVMFTDSESSDVERISDIIKGAGGEINESWTDKSQGPALVAYVPHYVLTELVQDSEVSWIEDHDYQEVIF